MIDRARGMGRQSHWRYSKFDGTSPEIAFDAEAILAQVTDDLLYHGDLSAALRRLLQEGFQAPFGERVQGITEMMQKIADRKSQLGSRQNDRAQEIAAALDEVVSLERRELQTRSDESSMTQSVLLELLPDDLLEKIQELMDYPFASPDAAKKFDELLDRLRNDVLQSHLDRAAADLAQMSEEEQRHLREGLDELNQLIERHANGEELDSEFSQFMNQYGDLFPGNPQSLDELIAQLAYRMAAAAAMLSSMSDEQRRQFESLSNQLLSDVDLAWQMDRLQGNLRSAMPQLGWEDRLAGDTSDAFASLGDLEAIRDLAALNELESQLAQASTPDGLRELNSDAARDLLGEDVARSLDALAEMTARLEQAGLVGRREGQLQLTPSGIRSLGSHALRELFSRLRRDRVGNHQSPTIGLGHDRASDSKPYEYGDPFRLDLQTTLRNALLRESADEHSRGKFPVSLRIEDFEIEQTEHLTTASTVLAIDLSLSMPMEDNFLAAKKVAIALQSLISSQYPRDYLGLVGFSATAREIGALELPSVSWDFAYGTNLQHALLLARQMLGGRPGAKQIIVITDGEPTAHVDDRGEVFFNYPAMPETIERTMLEVRRCTNSHIVINTFVLNSTGALRSFVDRMTRMNKGRAFYTTPEALGDYVLVDFVSNRGSTTRKRLRRGA